MGMVLDTLLYISPTTYIELDLSHLPSLSPQFNLVVNHLAILIPPSFSSHPISSHLIPSHPHLIPSHLIPSQPLLFHPLLSYLLLSYLIPPPKPNPSICTLPHPTPQNTKITTPLLTQSESASLASLSPTPPPSLPTRAIPWEDT